MQKIDKKQLPQLVGLCVLSTGTFGYFALRMMTPSPAAAATRPVLKPVVPAADPAAKAASPADAAIGDAAVPPPAPGMRDPFVVGYTAPKAAGSAPTAPASFTAPTASTALPHGGSAPAAGTQMASAQIREIPPAPVSGLTMPGFPAAPPAPALPSSVSALPPQKVLPLPAPPPAPPKWSVTGLLQGEDGLGIAVLRDGESRRIVHTGDFVDGVFRVVSVSRSAVVLRHGATSYTLALGTKPEAPSVPTAPAVPSLPATPSLPAMPPASAPLLPRQSLTVPARRLQTETIASALPLRLLDGTELSAREAGASAAPNQQIASLVR